MTTTTTNSLFATGKAALEFSRRMATQFLDSVPEDQLGYPPEGKLTNAIWIMGHLAHTDDYFLAALGGQERRTPDTWDGLFGMNSEPQDASAYPPLGEIRQAYDECRAAVLAWFESKSDEELLEELSDDWKGFAPTYAALMSSLAIHEGMHCGQLACVRKSLGLPYLFGQDAES